MRKPNVLESMMYNVGLGNMLYSDKQKAADDKRITDQEALWRAHIAPTPQENPQSPPNDYVYKGVLKDEKPAPSQAIMFQPTATPTITDTEQQNKRMEYAKKGWTRPDMTPAEQAVVPKPVVTPPPDEAANPYYLQINESAKKYGVPQDILYRVLRKESMGFNPKVISGELNSPVGAQGIAQFMPATVGGRFDPLDPKVAIPEAAKYLAAKFKEFGTWEKALAAYNAGSGAVHQYNGIPPYPETQNYVRDIMPR